MNQDSKLQMQASDLRIEHFLIDNAKAKARQPFGRLARGRVQMNQDSKLQMQASDLLSWFILTFAFANMSSLNMRLNKILSGVFPQDFGSLCSMCVSSENLV